MMKQSVADWSRLGRETRSRVRSAATCLDKENVWLAAMAGLSYTLPYYVSTACRPTSSNKH